MHPFHIVNARPWPLTGALSALLLFSGFLRVLHLRDFILLILGLLCLSATLYQWWRDVCRESTIQGKHTSFVVSGLRVGMLLFIVREVCFFFSFFWAFFHSALSIEFGWPPHIIPIDPMVVPLLNTVVLLSRGATITWAHMALLVSKWIEVRLSISATVFLGILFTSLQFFEYKYCPFTISDSVYGSVFYIATGFHGLHVILGAIFILCIFFRFFIGHFSRNRHFGFEARAWYWHFVDVVWLFLFLSVYWWGRCWTSSDAFHFHWKGCVLSWYVLRRMSRDNHETNMKQIKR